MKASNAYEGPGIPFFKANGMIWSNSSVLTLLKEGLPGETPPDIIRRKARTLVQQATDLRWEGPPFDPATLASLLGIEIVAANEPLGSEARVFPKADGTVRIEYDNSYPRTRINFSICHELTHTFFPDCYETVRHRNHLSPQERKHKELESLCDIGAAELLMPAGAFAQDLQAQPTSLETIVRLAERYGASVEAAMIRAAEFANDSFGVAVLSEKFKPSERRAAETSPLGFIGTEMKPKMRVDYVAASKKFRVFVPKDKSAPNESVVYQAITLSGVHTGREAWDIHNFGLRQVQAVALPKINGVNRVAAFFFD